MTPTRTASTVTTAFATALILAACSQGDPSSAGPAGATTSAATVAATASSSSKTTSQPSASGSASATPSVPAGHQAITAPTVGITFAVPEDWQNTPLDATSDIYYKAPDDGFTPYLGNANVSKTVVPATSTPTEAQMSPALTSIPGGTSTGYSTEQTANGEAAVLNYTASIGGQTVNGALIAAPTKDKGKYAIVSVNAGSSGQTIDELKTTVIETIH